MEKKYVTTPWRSDGIGQQAMGMICGLQMAKRLGLTYLHRPFIADAVRKTPAERAEAFFNFGHGEQPLDPNLDRALFTYSCSRIDPFRWEAISATLKARYYLTPKTTTYDPTKVNVAFHVRRGDVVRGHYSNRFTENSVILALQKQIASLGCTLSYHLFSQGEPKDFEGFDEFQLHLNEDVFDTFHHLVAADVLVMAKSAFSYTAALLSEGVKVYEPYWHPPVMDWIVAHPAAPFDVDLLAYKLGG